MLDGEWRLVHPGADITFGTGATPIFNQTTPELGDTEIRQVDAAIARGDGVNFGVDFRGGRTISFDLGVQGMNETDVRTVSGALSSAWRADPVRSTPGAVASLFMRYRGVERVVFGRPRRFAPVLAQARTGLFAAAVADFACADDLFYDAVESQADVTIAPGLGGGFMFPVKSPLTTTATADRSVVMAVTTDRPVWPVVEIRGPIVNPVVDIGPVRFAFNISLIAGDVLIVDTRPWARTVLRNGASVAGTLTRTSTRLSKAAIPAGSHELSILGQDNTGTSSARVRWRGAYTTP